MKSMYCSEPQIRLLDALEQLGCMKMRQAKTFLRLCFGMEEKAAKSIIRQLRYKGDIHIDENTGDLVIPGKECDRNIIRAFDIAFSFAEQGDAPEIITPPRPYLMLAYYAVRELQLLILYVPVGMEWRCGTQLSVMRKKAQIKTLQVMLLADEGQLERIGTHVPCVAAYTDSAGRLKIKSLEGKHHGD